jgi:hypothetical protein
MVPVEENGFLFARRQRRKSAERHRFGTKPNLDKLNAIYRPPSAARFP